MTSPTLQTMSEAEYLRWEGTQEAKWEFVDGFVYAQAGASKVHGLIAGNVLYELLAAARNTPCYVIPSDMKVRVERGGHNRYYLPDIVVTCQSNMVGNIETTPCLLVEIQSASTRLVDETFKATDYRNISSLQGYLVIDSERKGVTFHRRTEQGWQLEQVTDQVHLPCLNITLSLSDIYRNVPL